MLLSVGESASDSATSPTSVLPDCAKLRRLRNVLAQDELRSAPSVTKRSCASAAPRRDHAAHVQGSRWPRDGHADRHDGEATSHVNAGIVARPEHEAARRVLVRVPRSA